MSDRAAFLRAIIANPDDDLPRLVYADWLEERGDPLGEFIRTQIELEAIRNDSESARNQELRELEQELLRAHSDTWLGAMAASESSFAPRFRRGFIESAVIHSDDLTEHGEVIPLVCPLLRELAVYDVRGKASRFAHLSCLRQLRALELCDWPYPDDAELLAESEYLEQLETLTVWLGSRNDEATCTILAGALRLRNVREFRLLQLYGGLAAGAEADRLNTRADQLAWILNTAQGTEIARVVRPFERLFPMRGDVGREIYAGTLPDGRATLAFAGRNCALLLFDADGRLTGIERHDLSAELHRPPRWPWRDFDEEEVLPVLTARTGFELGEIRVREFGTDDPDLSVGLFDGMHVELIADPDNPPRFDFEDWANATSLIKFWLDSTNYVINGDYWADDRGRIHTT